MSLASLRDSRLVLVTGKGGTGKTTYAAAIAEILAASGRRTLLVEIDSQRPALPGIFDVEVGITPRAVRPGLEVANLVWPDVLGEYLRAMVRIGGVVKAILGNEMVRRFLDFTPGSQELVILSVLADLVDRYDTVVVDLPASGHAFSMLDITRSALGLFRGGPLRRRVVELRQRLQDPRTRLVLVALPEEMVVNETLETLDRFRRFELLGGPPVVVLNRARKPTLSDGERTLLDRLSAANLDEDAAEFVAAGRWERSLEDAATQAEARLTAGLGRAPVWVPPTASARGADEVVRGVAEIVAPAFGVEQEALPWT